MRQHEPLHIAYVIKAMDVGGSQTHLLEVLRLLDRRRFRPCLFCLTGAGQLLDQVRALDVPVFAPAAGGGFKGLGFVKRIAALTSELRRQRPDIVHNYLLRANLTGSISARLAGVPIVLCSKRGCHWRRGFELFAAKTGNFLADRVTVNADAVRDFVHGNEGCALDKMVVIPSGVDTDRFRPLAQADYKTRLGIPSDRTTVGVVTRMRVRKGVDEFIRSIAIVRRNRPDVHGVVVGEVEPDATLDRLVADLGLKDHLSFLGRRNDMPEVYSAFDLFVLCSHDEGMSNAILEAMAMEKAVVATDVGGTGEVVQHGHTGLLVPAKDPEALASALEDIFAGDPMRALEMGRRGREIVVETFSSQAMVRRMEDLYCNLAAARRVLPWPEAEKAVGT
jgi:glycosyltransferase involved in cell wall biosynthesis